jgi:CdiI immunity protein
MKRGKDKAASELKPGGGATASEIATMQFPALRAFMRSYLHQDFGEEYGSVEEAVKAFCDDATEPEVSAVSVEWRAFLEAMRGRPLGEINNMLAAKLGCAWNAGSMDELGQIGQAFDECASGES